MFCNALVILHSQIKNRYKKKERDIHHFQPPDSTRRLKLDFFFFCWQLSLCFPPPSCSSFIYFGKQGAFSESSTTRTHTWKDWVWQDGKMYRQTDGHKQTDEESSALGLHNLNKLNASRWKKDSREEEKEKRSVRVRVWAIHTSVKVKPQFSFFVSPFRSD